MSGAPHEGLCTALPESSGTSVTVKDTWGPRCTQAVTVWPPWSSINVFSLTLYINWGNLWKKHYILFHPKKASTIWIKPDQLKITFLFLQSKCCSRCFPWLSIWALRCHLSHKLLLCYGYNNTCWFLIHRQDSPPGDRGSSVALDEVCMCCMCVKACSVCTKSKWAAQVKLMWFRPLSLFISVSPGPTQQFSMTRFTGPLGAECVQTEKQAQRPACKKQWSNILLAHSSRVWDVL